MPPPASPSSILPPALQLPDVEPRLDRDSEREALIVLLTGTVLLVMFYYWGRPGFYSSSGLIDWVSEHIAGPFVEYPGVGGYVWWGITSLVLRTLVPPFEVPHAVRPEMGTGSPPPAPSRCSRA